MAVVARYRSMVFAFPSRSGFIASDIPIGRAPGQDTSQSEQPNWEGLGLWPLFDCPVWLGPCSSWQRRNGLGRSRPVSGFLFEVFGVQSGQRQQGSGKLRLGSGLQVGVVRGSGQQRREVAGRGRLRALGMPRGPIPLGDQAALHGVLPLLRFPQQSACWGSLSPAPVIEAPVAWGS